MEISLNMYHAVALGAVMYWAGTAFTKRCAVLRKFCIPAPLVGGLVFAVFNTILYASGSSTFTMDNTLETVFMTMFFATIGFTVSIPMLAKGGKSVLMLLAVSIVMVIFQDVLGAVSMLVMGKNPLYGLGCGSISMVGGPGTAAAIGPDLEAAGAVGACAVSIAAATFGMVAGSAFGGPIAKRLIYKYDLRPSTVQTAEETIQNNGRFTTTGARFIKGFFMILLAVGAGNLVSTAITGFCGFSFPAYIGAMLVAMVIRNVADAADMEYPDVEIDVMGNMFLSIFLSMALCGLKLWQLVDLAFPMVVCLALQVVLMYVYATLVVFRLMGKDYDAAIMTGGFVGFGLGSTPNAVANMQALTGRYGPSPAAFFAVPMVGSLFIDFFNAAIIAFNIGFWS